MQNRPSHRPAQPPYPRVPPSLTPQQPSSPPAGPTDPQDPRNLFAAAAAPAPAPLRVVVADDNPVVRAGLTALLSGRQDVQVVAEAGNGREAYDAAYRLRPDVVLLDVRMPEVDGISALPYLVQLTTVLMLTYSQEAEIVHEALRLGAGGYLVHGEFTADELVVAIGNIKQGRAHFTATASTALLAHVRQAPGQGNGRPELPDGLGRGAPGAGHHAARSTAPPPEPAQYGLSRREEEVMDLIAAGMTNAEIAATCFISEKTVKNHINRIFTKLQTEKRSQAIALWLGTARGGGRAHG
ncbi:response regulator transcription factor [Streptomyces hiroshimensis]|uniref:DNA-binding response regulator n=1 Tax=Streptomyces hiroshimensis TaxID=66424 RepID=A0ABQ2YPF3_9ACTN|nr:response regulator transcription factor [Streptomyces hiroshimensis]GGX89449.1 DNA-binding response regulator [Streptomyces hiroshimensis]